MAYRTALLRVRRFPVPVVVVGDICAGGSEKTLLVSWLARHLLKLGWRPGIVSGGHGGQARRWPQQVRVDSDPVTVGEDAVLLAQLTRRPMAVTPDYATAVSALLAHTDVNIVIAHGGLQHYALARDIEIALIDGMRGLGNGRLLPAGPLREPSNRLDEVDFVVVSGTSSVNEDSCSMRLGRAWLTALCNDDEKSLEDFAGRKVHAVAGIANPERFFALLRDHDIDVEAHVFPQHHRYTAADVDFSPPLPLLMTATDAVKCRGIACRDCYVVHVEAEPDRSFVYRFNQLLEALVHGQEAARYPGLPDL